MAEHLHPSLLLLFLEPKTLQTFVPQRAPRPSFSCKIAQQEVGRTWTFALGPWAGYQLVRLICPRWTHSLYSSCVPPGSRHTREDFYECRGACVQAAGFFRHPSFLPPPTAPTFLPVTPRALSGLLGARARFFKATTQEWSCSGHEGLLRAAGVLGDFPKRRLLNRCPVAVCGPWTGQD